jgi:protocatechuate 3,4-dioxygenase beta subunit
MFDLDDDDAPVGRVLSRREALLLLGGAGAAGFFALAGCGSSGLTSTTDSTSGANNSDGSSSNVSCAVRPSLTEGPYFVDEKLNRSDIRSDTISGAVKGGALFALAFNVGRIQSNACAALQGVQVDVWHCDASGVYSDATDPGFNTKGQNWLRGYQVTDANGTARFTTIFPGWYAGRATHIHFKIRGTNASGASYDFTSQLFFSEDFLSAAYAQSPYSSRSDSGRLRNASDGIYSQGGSQLLLTPASDNGAYSASINVGLTV